MRLLELRFINLDADMAERLTFAELCNELALVGFTDHDRLEKLFHRVDSDKNGSLDFAEFLSLLYLWHNMERGDYRAFFQHPGNARLVAEAFTAMEAQMSRYDVDRSRRLDIVELRAFFQEQWPEAASSRNGVYEGLRPLFFQVTLLRWRWESFSG